MVRDILESVIGFVAFVGLVFMVIALAMIGFAFVLDGFTAVIQGSAIGMAESGRMFLLGISLLVARLIVGYILDKRWHSE